MEKWWGSLVKVNITSTEKLIVLNLWSESSNVCFLDGEILRRFIYVYG